MFDWLRPLLLLFYAPARGMAEVRDRVPVGRAALLALLAQMAYVVYTLSGALVAAELAEVASGVNLAFITVIFSVTALLPLALVFVPFVVFFANVFERSGSFGLVLRREYAAAAATVFYAWAAAALLALLVAVVLRATGFEAETHRLTQEVARIAEARQQPPPPEALDLMLRLLGRLALMFFVSVVSFMSWATVGARQGGGAPSA